jgi:hypothetical protein
MTIICRDRITPSDMCLDTFLHENEQQNETVNHPNCRRFPVKHPTASFLHLIAAMRHFATKISVLRIV